MTLLERHCAGNKTATFIRDDSYSAVCIMVQPYMYVVVMSVNRFVDVACSSMYLPIPVPSTPSWHINWGVAFWALSPPRVRRCCTPPLDQAAEEARRRRSLPPPARE
eukprot:COSAG01_NODE_42233_length_442_cov_0.755102_1_plen_106_part_10